MAQVKDCLTGKTRKVKNLGWLTDNWKHVESIQVTARKVYQGEYVDGNMLVVMDNGLEYSTTWASLDVCWSWLQRSIFEGVDLVWLGYKTKVTKGNPRPEGL